MAFDLRFLFEASKKLHGYFLHTWFKHYLVVIMKNARRLIDYGGVGPYAQPTEETDYALFFDIDALDLEKITYIVGIYFYILSRHKQANRHLMQENETKRILSLQGYDYEGSVQVGERRAMLP